MNIRTVGLHWIASQRLSVQLQQALFSQLYSKEKSWPRKPVWWFEFADSKFSRCEDGILYLFCQKEIGMADFHQLVVPVEYFRRNLLDLGYRRDTGKFSLYLLNEPSLEFREIRGAGRIQFGQFRRH